MVNKNKFLKRFVINRNGTAEVIGTVLFIIILLFAFSNIYLWHDNAVTTMNTLLSDKLNSQIQVYWLSDNQTLAVTNIGGVGASLSRLWIITSQDSTAQHLFADLTNIDGASRGMYVAPGTTVGITLTGSASPIVAHWINSQNVTVTYTRSPQKTETFTVLTTLGNMASPIGIMTIVISNGGGNGNGNQIGDFVPDYHSVQWAQVTNSKPGTWNSGWIIPSASNKNLIWKVSVTYYGATNVNLDQNSQIFLAPLGAQQGNGHAPPTFFLVTYDGTNLHSVPASGMPVPSSGSGTSVTLYFASGTAGGSPNGVTIDTHDSNTFMMSLMIYGVSPSTYAQSFPLYATQIR